MTIKITPPGNPNQPINLNNNQEQKYYTELAWLQGKAAYCENEDQLSFHIVNNTIKIVKYNQAVLWQESAVGIKVLAVSGVSVINRTAPYISFLEKQLIPAILKRDPGISQIDTEQYQDITESYNDYIFPWILSLPFHSYNSNPKYDKYKINTGVLLLRSEEWSEAEIEKSTNIVKYYKYLWDLFLKQTNKHLEKVKKAKKYKYIILTILILLMIIPIKESVLVPAEIAPREPSVVAPSIAGMIEKVYVRPNESVKQGQELFKLDTISLNNKHEQAIKNLDVINEKYRKAYQHSYNDPKATNELRVLESEIKIAQNELAYSKSLLERAIIRADFNGTVIFSDPKNWLGRPVEVGERVMLLADEAKVQLDLFIPIDDLIPLESDAKVVFFPNPRPLDTIDAKIDFISKEAEIQPDDTLAYYTVAYLESDSADNKTDKFTQQFGIKGTAKIYGNRVPLIYYLLRKPISWFRRKVGV